MRPAPGRAGSSRRTAPPPTRRDLLAHSPPGACRGRRCRQGLPSPATATLRSTETPLSSSACLSHQHQPPHRAGNRGTAGSPGEAAGSPPRRPPGPPSPPAAPPPGPARPAARRLRNRKAVGGLWGRARSPPGERLGRSAGRRRRWRRDERRDERREPGGRQRGPAPRELPTGLPGVAGVGGGGPPGCECPGPGGGTGSPSGGYWGTALLVSFFLRGWRLRLVGGRGGGAPRIPGAVPSPAASREDAPSRGVTGVAPLRALPGERPAPPEPRTGPNAAFHRGNTDEGQGSGGLNFLPDSVIQVN